MDFGKIYRELIRRNVFRAVLAYLAVAWVLIEATSIILPTFDAPPYLLKGLIYLIAIGLVVWTGFAWVYDLTPEGIQKTPEKTDTTETRQLNNRRLNAVIVGAGIAALLVLLAGSFWAGSRWSGATIPSKDYRIAVLPFDDRSDNAEFEYLREGLAEDVTGKLFGYSEVSVISPRSTFQFKDTDKSLAEISKELNADILLVGSYEVTNEKVDVKVQVVKGTDNELLNYASVSGDLPHIRELVSKIGYDISEALGLQNMEKQDPGTREIQNVNIEAYKLNALGKSAMRDHTGQQLEEITQFFQAAIALDPDYADPYIGMAEAYIFDVNRGYLSPIEGAQKAKEYALMAEKLNPGRGEVSGILGIIHNLDYQYGKAIPYYEKSLEKSPNFSLTYPWYAFALYLELGDFDKAETLLKKATVVDPLNTFNDIFLAMNYIFQDKFDRAEEIIDARLSMDPDHIEMLWMKTVLLVEKGLYQEAYETILKRKEYLETNFISGYVFAKVGQKDHAEKVLNNILDRSQKTFVPPSQIAILMCGLGMYEQALDQIEEAFLVHDQWIAWIPLTSMADPIKDNPRYKSLMNTLVKG